MFERQISHYQETRQHYEQIQTDSEKALTENKALKIYKRSFFVALSAVMVLIYLMVYMVIFFHESDVPVLRSVLSKIIETWPSLFSLLIIPIVSKIYSHQIKKRDSK